MKNLRKRGGSFYYDHGGKPRRWEPLGNNEAVAIRKYHEIAATPAAGTVDAMLRECIEGMEGKVRPATLVNYRIFRKHLSGVFGHLRPDEINQAHILQYLDACPRMSFRGEIALLSAGYKGWMRSRGLTFNPCFGVKCDRAGSKRDRLLSDDEIDALVAAADERMAVAIELAYATGLRIGDLCALRWGDVSEGIQMAKTGARLVFERSEALDAILARARALQSRVASLYVLCGRGGKRWTPDALRRQWDNTCKRAGVEDAHFHDLRAKGATDTEKLGGRDAAQAFLGHRNGQTTETYLRDKRANVVTPLVRRSSTKRSA